MSLSKTGFLAITAVARADGLVRTSETEALLRAARECGLDAKALDDVRDAIHDGVDLSNLDIEGLSPPEQGLTYALAMWLAKVDGVVNTDELNALRSLRARLELPDAKLAMAAAAANDIACTPGGHRPDKFEFAKLEARLRQKLPALMGQ